MRCIKRLNHPIWRAIDSWLTPFFVFFPINETMCRSLPVLFNVYIYIYMEIWNGIYMGCQIRYPCVHPTNSWDLAGMFLNDFMVPGKRLHNHWTWPSRNTWFTHSKWWFPIVMLNYQEGNSTSNLAMGTMSSSMGRMTSHILWKITILETTNQKWYSYRVWFAFPYAFLCFRFARPPRSETPAPLSPSRAADPKKSALAAARHRWQATRAHQWRVTWSTRNTLFVGYKYIYKDKNNRSEWLNEHQIY